MTNKIVPVWNPDGSCSTNSENKTFCMAPWTHTYISPQGERRLCCASREEHSFQKQYIDASNDEKYGTVKESKTDANDFNPLTLEEHWNSAYMRDIRKKLMAGERISQCDVCNDDILSISSYRKWFTGVLFKDKIEAAFEQTDEDGYTTMPAISFDYRYSNLCNFKCRMCGEQLSSSWESEKKKHDLWTPQNQPFMLPEVKQKMTLFQRNVVEPEFKKAISDGIVEEIYWVGGEPLMYDIHWWALEEMIQNNSAKNCYLRYNSNLSRIEYKGMNLFDYLPQFKNWLMCASIDGTGQIVEFIRKGIVWEDWLENFKTGLASPHGKDRMMFDLTITGPGMFALKDLFDLSLELDVRIETKIMFAFHPDIVFSPFAWPKHILDRKIDELLQYMDPVATHKQMSLVNTLKEMKRRPTFAEQWPDSHKKSFFNGRNWQNKLDVIRQEQHRIEDIYKEDNELYDWWTQIDSK
jgi:Iron-sulfur cluster-binding domain